MSYNGGGGGGGPVEVAYDYSYTNLSLHRQDKCFRVQLCTQVRV